MSQDNNNNTNEENKFVNNDQSGWASGNFPTIDLNFDIDEDELNEALKQDQQKRRVKHSKHGKKGEHQHDHEHGPNCDHDHDHEHDHHDGDDDCDDCCGPKYKKEDITAEMLKKAEETYEEGLGAYKEGDYSTAADSFSEAVSVLAPYYGDDDLKMVDIYYHYGDAILNLARQKILSSIIIDMDDGDFDEEGDNIVPNIHFNHKKNLKGDLLKIEEVDDDENVIEVLQGDGDEDDLEDDDYLAELEEEVADDLEVAWDILETARAILNHKSGDNPDLEKLSNIHLSLGSIGVETENVDLAIQEYNECISLRKKLFGDRHRKTAEAYYMLAMAYCSPENAKFDIAIEKLTETQGILEENLKSAEEQKNEMDVIELSELLEEVKLRIEDLKDPNFKFGNFLDIEGEDDDDDN